jgi:valyl-tRNA synthetase
MLSKTQALIEHATDRYLKYDYAGARQAAEIFLWTDLADNYIELVKQRLYLGEEETTPGAAFGLHASILSLIKILAPILPYITEAIYQALFCQSPGEESIHNASWPLGHSEWRNVRAEEHGQYLIDVTTAVRRYKSERSLSLAEELDQLTLACASSDLRQTLEASIPDLMSSTRARKIEILTKLPEDIKAISADPVVQVALSIGGS